MKYQKLIQQLQENNLLQDNFSYKDDNLNILLSSTVELILYQGEKRLDLYINNHYFGPIENQNMVLVFQALLSDSKVFIEYRIPNGMYPKEYFKIETKEWFEKRRQKLSKRRGIKVYDINEVIIDKY